MYIQAFTAAAPVSARETPATPAPSDTLVKSGFDGSSGVSYLSPDGLLLAVTDKDGIDIFDVSTPGAPAARSRVALAGVVNVAFSPLGNLLVSWHRKRADERACTARRFSPSRTCRTSHSRPTPPPLRS